MKNVLVPTDFSQNSWNALTYALTFFDAVPCNFFILHVADLREAPIDAFSFVLTATENRTPAKEQLQELLERLKSSCDNELHHFFPLLTYGNLVDALRRKVEENKIDLIAMGTKGATGLKKLVIGSNTGDVITKVKCNTLVIPENSPKERPKEIAFPTDYTLFYSHAILTAISEMILLNKANLGVMNVTLVGEELHNIQSENKTYLQDYLEEVFPKSHRFHTVSNKKVISAIQQFTENHQLDMIIMVAKNLNFLQQLLFDSTIEKLSFHASVPFLVLHE